MANIPYEQEAHKPRLMPRGSLPVVWIAAAAVLALLLIILLRS